MDFDAQTLEFFATLIVILATQTKTETKTETKTKGEMPEVLQAIIQDFARPLCRGDWRTCKREESRAIHLLLRDKRDVAADFLGGAEFWDIVVGHTFYELLKNYPAGPPSEEGQTTIQLRRHWG
jgi:hypothetical protein